jgi:lauroyl/myristoyl acyltransferase
MTLALAGFPPVHLSRPTHGGFRTPWGIKYLNPIKTSVEDRFLKRRVVIWGNQTVGPLRELRRSLKANEVVTITVAQTASRVTEIPFLEGHVRLPAGPLQLARTSGAPILPVFTLPAGKRGYRVIIEPPLDLANEDPEVALRQFASSFERHTRAYPGAWSGWRTRLYVPPAIRPGS